MKRLSASILLGGVLFGAAGTAQAEEAKGAPPHPERDARMTGDPEHPLDAPIDSDEKRKVPDYDGRPETTSAGDVLIWVPRVVLSPAYLVSEFVVRRPLGALVTLIEKEKVVPKVFDFFTFGPHDNIGIVPTGLIDFGFRPSVGVYFFWDDFIAKDNDLRSHAATWGPDWLLFNLKNRAHLGPHQDITVRGEFERRSDWVFHGIGPESSSTPARFQATSLQGGFLHHADLWRSSEVETFVTVRDVSFDASKGCCEEEVLSTDIARGRLLEPPGLADGYTILESGVMAELDTRKPKKPDDLPEASDYVTPPGTGFKLQLRGVHANGLRESPRPDPAAPSRYHWLKYGGTLAGYFDITGDQRVVSLSLIGDFADPIDSGTNIPFTELVSLGGDRPMRGFLEGRLLGRSSAVAQIEYQWPIWVWVDAAMHYSVGNVFGEHLDGFETKLLRQSFGIGFKTSSSRDHVFETLLAFGTETFDQGAGVENVRFVFGGSSGF